MPNWKKVLLSGSKAAVYDITASNLPGEVGSTNDVIVLNSSGHFSTASRGDFGGSAKGPLGAVQFAYTEDGGSSFLLSGSNNLLFDEPNAELLISASGEGQINIGRDGGNSGISINNTLGSLNFIGTGSNIINGPSATIQAVAVEDFSANTKAAKLEFYTADNQDTDLGIPKLTISASLISSSVTTQVPTLKADNISIINQGDITFQDQGNTLHGIIFDEQTDYGARIVYDGGNDKVLIQTLQNTVYQQGIQIHRTNGNVQIGGSVLSAGDSPPSKLTVQGAISASSNILTDSKVIAEGDITSSGNLRVAGNTHIVGTAQIDDLEINGHIISDGGSNNQQIDFSANDIDLKALTDIRVYLDTNNNDSTGVFEVVHGSQTEANTTRSFTVTQDGEVSASGKFIGTALEVDTDITASGLKITSLTSTVDQTSNLLVLKSNNINSTNFTLNDTIYVSASSNSGLSRTGVGPYTFSLDLDSLATSTTNGDGDFFAVVDSSGNQKKLTKGNIDLGGFDNSSTNFGTGTIGGTGVGGTNSTNRRIAFFTDASTIDDDSGLTYNTGTNGLTATSFTASEFRVASKIVHTGDTDTSIQFFTDEIQLRAGENDEDVFLILKGSNSGSRMRGSLQVEGPSGPSQTWNINITSSVTNGLAHDDSEQSPMIDFVDNRGGNANPLGGIRFLNQGDGGGDEFGGSYVATGIFAYNQFMGTSGTNLVSSSGADDGMLEFWVTDGGTGKRALALAQDANIFAPYVRNNTGTNYLKYNTGTKEITYQSSRRETKTNITDIRNKNNYLTTEGFSKIKPKTFSYKNEPNTLTGGFIAEELAEVNPILASWGPNNKITPDGEIINNELIDDKIVPIDVNDRALLALCVAKIQELETEIKLLKSKEL